MLVVASMIPRTPALAMIIEVATVFEDEEEKKEKEKNDPSLASYV